MEEFPENLELLDFFDAEPRLSDPGLPWAYNRLEFSTPLGEERVDCIIDNPQLQVRWFRNEVEVACLTFERIQSLKVQHYPGGKALVAQGFGPEQNVTFRLQLRPMVHLAVETSP